MSFVFLAENTLNILSGCLVSGREVGGDGFNWTRFRLLFIKHEHEAYVQCADSDLTAIDLKDKVFGEIGRASDQVRVGGIKSDVGDDAEESAAGLPASDHNIPSYSQLLHRKARVDLDL